MPDPNQNLSIIDDTDQAAYLTKLENLIYLEPFLGQEMAVTDAANKASVKLHQMFYQVAKMQKIGLLRLTRSEQRAGKKVKLYRATHPGFFIPLMVTPFENLSAFFYASSTIMLEQQCNAQAQTLLKNRSERDYGFKITSDGEDLNFNLSNLEPAIPTAPDPKARLSEHPMVMGFGRLRMSRKKAEALRNMLQELNETTEDNEGVRARGGCLTSNL
jgi:3-methyladenine DNA glycosylase/8-oxoguanine DNA glycosylase